MRITVGNVYSKVTHYTNAEDALLTKILCVSVPNYQFMTAYKNGRWDGTKRFYSAYKSFPSGFLPFVIEQAHKNKFKVETDDERNVPGLQDPSRIAQMYPNLRSYQWEGLTNVLVSTLHSANQILPWPRGCIKFPTGSGKTPLAACLIDFIGKKTLYLLERQELMYQTARAFAPWTSMTVGLLGDGCEDLTCNITFAMAQTIQACFDAEHRYQARIKRLLHKGKSVPSQAVQSAARNKYRRRKASLMTFLKGIECLVIDEVQHHGEGIYHTIATKCPAPFRFGVSATPLKRGDLGDVYLIADIGEIIAEGEQEEITAQGYLARPKVYMFDVTSPQLGNCTHPHAYQLGIVDNDSRNEMVVSAERKLHRRGCTVLVLVQHREHGKALLRMLKRSGLRCRFIYGLDSTEDRQDALQRIGDDFDVLVSTKILDEGIDLPSLDALIRAGGGQSYIKTLQQVGRTLRPKSGRNEVFIVDFMDRTQRYLLKHANARLAAYESQGFKIAFPKHI